MTVLSMSVCVRVYMHASMHLCVLIYHCLTSLSPDPCDLTSPNPPSPTHATKGRPGVRAHAQQPQRSLAASLGPGAAVPRDLPTSDPRRRTQRLGESHSSMQRN